jgi:hypothetical protein
MTQNQRLPHRSTQAGFAGGSPGGERNPPRAVLRPLARIPFAAKDLFLHQGIRNTCGSKILADFVPGMMPRSSTYSPGPFFWEN